MNPRAMSVAVPAPSTPCVGTEFDVDAFGSRETAASPMREDVDSWTVSRPVSDVRTSGTVLGIGMSGRDSTLGIGTAARSRTGA
jgi:hypothetical protein